MMIKVGLEQGIRAGGIDIYVVCGTVTQDAAVRVRAFFNKFEGLVFTPPALSAGTWTTRTLCHLGVDDVERGNTVADCFLRVLNIIARCDLDANLSSDVRTVVGNNLENEKKFSTFHYLIGLSKLNAILNKTESLPAISDTLKDKASEFHLTAEQQEGLEKVYVPLQEALRADGVILERLDTSSLNDLKNSPKAKEGLLWSWLTYAWSIVVGIWNYFCGTKAID
ncbi:MAG: hypothetical protein ABSA17_02635 [Rhabdochlamydiaceae bacterium]